MRVYTTLWRVTLVAGMQIDQRAGSVAECPRILMVGCSIGVVCLACLQGGGPGWGTKG